MPDCAELQRVRRANSKQRAQRLGGISTALAAVRLLQGFAVLSDVEAFHLALFVDAQRREGCDQLE